jgi:hypothetical protein
VKRVYIAGPFAHSSEQPTMANVRRAATFRLPIAAAGGCPVCPHTNTGDLDGTLTVEKWLAITMVLMEGCDALLLLPDWRRYSGARAERERAYALGMPTFEALTYGVVPESLVRYLGGG